MDSFEVIDGDTVRSNGLGSFRLLGINTPELNISKRNLGREPYSLEATEYLKSLLSSGQVFYESNGRDKYGRLLSDLWVKSSKSDSLRFVSELMLQKGLAFQVFESSSFYIGCLRRAEKQARILKLGVWGRLDYWLNKNRGGFVVWTGKALKISTSKRYKWVSMSSERVLRIPIEWFSGSGISEASLKTGFEVRGWAVHRKNTKYESYMLPLKRIESLQEN